MIRVNGTFTVKADYVVELKLSVEEFDNLSERQQNHLIETSVDMFEVLRSAEVDDLDVWDVEEVE